MPDLHEGRDVRIRERLATLPDRRWHTGRCQRPHTECMLVQFHPSTRGIWGWKLYKVILSVTWKTTRKRIVREMLERVSSENIQAVLGGKGQYWHWCRNRAVSSRKQKPQTGHRTYKNTVDDLAFQIYVGLERVVWKIIKRSAYFISNTKIETN